MNLFKLIVILFVIKVLLELVSYKWDGVKLFNPIINIFMAYYLYAASVDLCDLYQVSGYSFGFGLLAVVIAISLVEVFINYRKFSK